MSRPRFLKRGGTPTVGVQESGDGMAFRGACRPTRGRKFGHGPRHRGYGWRGPWHTMGFMKASYDAFMHSRWHAMEYHRRCVEEDSIAWDDSEEAQEVAHG